MWNYIIAGLAGFVLGAEIKRTNTTKSKPKEENKSKEESKPKNEKPTSWKDKVNSDIEKEGFDYAFRAYSNYPEVKNKKFQELRKEYVKSADKLEKYLDKNNIEDSEADVDTESVIAKEGFEDLFVYHDWKGVKDKKFKELATEYKASRKALEKHLK